jgi:hypothetical protein
MKEKEDIPPTSQKLFKWFLVPQKASALERKSLVAQGTFDSHPYRCAPFRLILCPILHVRKQLVMGEKKN